MSLKGKRALVTRSTSGIGLGIAAQLAGAGCDLVLNGFGAQEAIQSLLQKLRQHYGVKEGHVPGDVSRLEECELLVRGATEFSAASISW